MLKDISLRYSNVSYMSAHQIRQPDDIKDYIDSKYSNKDKVDVALFLDTKNRVINSMIIPDNLSTHNRFKLIMENAILNDSNSYVLATKDSSLPSMTSMDRVNITQEIRRKSDAVGITLLDYIDIRALNSISYKQMNFLEEKNIYNEPSKTSMQERFKNAIAEADKRNINKNKGEISTNQEQQL